MTDDTFIPTGLPDAELNGGALHGRLLEVTRALIDDVTAAHAPDDITLAAMADIVRASEKLKFHGVPHDDAPAGHRPDLPGEGHPALAPTVIDSWSDTEVHGRVTLTRAHEGGGSAAHGGWLPMIYDDVLGRLVARTLRARTAFIHVNYKVITPVGVELSIEGSIDRIEGRKIWAIGTIRYDEQILTQAEGLFLRLLPGQQ